MAAETKIMIKTYCFITITKVTVQYYFFEDMQWKLEDRFAWFNTILIQ